MPGECTPSSLVTRIRIEVKLASATGASGLSRDREREPFGVAGLHVPLPPRAVGVDHPGLGLGRVAADGVVDARGLEALVGETGLGGDDLLPGLGLDAEVVQRAALGG